MAYYTIQDNSIITAEKESSLKKYYRDVLPLPDDYEEGKYIVQDGVLTINEHFETEQALAERERISMLSLTKREVFLALYKNKGITPEQLREQITDPEALIEFDFANEYYRGNSLIDKVGIMLGYSTEDLDYLFVNKKLPDVDNLEEDEEEKPTPDDLSEGEDVDNFQADVDNESEV